jgi:L-amino acid N-acyltransferase YncA
MEFVIREFSSADVPGIVDTFRDANNVLRKSKGGTHPDKTIDRIVNLPDNRLADMLTKDAFVLVAAIDGKIAGFTAFSNCLTDRILKTVYGKNLYVREKFQRGKAGINVGKELLSARKERMLAMGIRKYYSYSVPEAVGFQKKIGAKFHPFHDSYSLNESVKMKYFEVDIRPTMLNAVRVEPFIFELKFLLWKLRSGGKMG